MKIKGHFTKVEAGASIRDHHIRALRCKHCDFSVSPLDYRKAGDKSGLGRYNRAQAAMSKHLHEAHSAMLALSTPGEQIVDTSQEALDDCYGQGVAAPGEQKCG